MQIIFRFWRKSLEVLYPKNFKLFLSIFFKKFFKSTVLFLRFFGFLFIVDFALFVWLGDVILKTRQLFVTPEKSINTSAVLLHLTISIIWFMLSVGFLLSIRRPYKNIGWMYFRNGFLKYVQLALVFSLIVLLLFNLISGFGITVFPTFHWSLNVLIRLIEVITIFYWLDSSYRFRDMFFSFERALNFVLYNFPFFLFLFLFWWLFKWAVGFVLIKLGFSLDFNMIFSSIATGTEAVVLPDSYSFFSIIKSLGLKYLLFFWDYFVITFIFVFYTVKKKDKYTYGFFEERSE